jgi:hypothetical protein
MLSPHLEHDRSSIPSTVVRGPGAWPTRKQMSRRKLPIIASAATGGRRSPGANPQAVHIRFAGAGVASPLSRDGAAGSSGFHAGWAAVAWSGVRMLAQWIFLTPDRLRVVDPHSLDALDPAVEFAPDGRHHAHGTVPRTAGQANERLQRRGSATTVSCERVRPLPVVGRTFRRSVCAAMGVSHCATFLDPALTTCALLSVGLR